MESATPPASKLNRRDRPHMWCAFLGVPGLILLSSLAGRQLYEMIPPAAV